MRALRPDQKWAAMIWLAHTHARAGDYSKANALLDLVQVESKARCDASDGAIEAQATAAMHAAMELRRSLDRMARS